MKLYDRVILEIFHRHDGMNQDSFEFHRDELRQILDAWGETVRNLGDILYAYRSGRNPLPTEIAVTGYWIIDSAGRSKYVMRKLKRSPYIEPPTDLETIDILDATPEIILRYGKADEQGLLTRVRYNRLIDTFLGITAYHLQSHVRAFVKGSGQIEIDDIYFGVDTDGNQYVTPVEGKTAGEPLGVVQITSMNLYARKTFPELNLRPVAVKLDHDGSIFFMEFCDATDSNDIRTIKYKRYQLTREDVHVSADDSTGGKA